jgi:hypothetical protein
VHGNALGVLAAAIRLHVDVGLDAGGCKRRGGGRTTIHLLRGIAVPPVGTAAGRG